MYPNPKSMALGHCALLLASFASSSKGQLSSTGFTVSLNDIPYYISPDPIASINITDSFARRHRSGFFTPVTVVSTDDVGFSGDIFASLVSNWTVVDDVFQNGFLEGNHLSTLSANLRWDASNVPTYPLRFLRDHSMLFFPSPITVSRAIKLHSRLQFQIISAFSIPRRQNVLT